MNRFSLLLPSAPCALFLILIWGALGQPFAAESPPPVLATDEGIGPLKPGFKVNDKAALGAWKEAIRQCEEAFRERSFEKAKEYGARSCELAMQGFGNYHLNTGTSFYILGEILFELGEFKEAAKAASTALLIRNRLLEPDAIELGYSSNSLAQIYYVLGRFDRARELNERALIIWKQHLKNNHANFAVTYSNLGKLAHQEKDYEGALRQYEKAHEIIQTKFGAFHPNLGASFFNLAEAMRHLNDLPEAEMNYRASLDVTRETFGSDHPDIILGMHKLARVMEMQGKNDEATKMYRTVLANADDHLPHLSSAYLELLKDLRTFYAATNNQRMSIGVERRIERLLKTLPEDKRAIAEKALTQMPDSAPSLEATGNPKDD